MAPRTRIPARQSRVALAGYVSVALLFVWPLPMHLGTMLPGPVSTDTGVYVWNLWVFRHEIVAHHQLPFVTPDILSLAPAVPLALHNYTTLANVLAFPLLPVLGTVATYNLLVIASGVISAFAMFLFARHATGDSGGAWVAGLVFGFCPFMSARLMEHFSLVQTAPLVLFAFVFDRIRLHPTALGATAVGASVAVAFLCDPYYAVYCLLMGGFAVGYSAIAFHESSMAVPRRLRAILTAAIVCLAGLVAGIVVRGGGRFEILGLHVSMTQLYTPVLLLTLAVALRAWVSVRSRIAWVAPAALPPMRIVIVAALICGVLLSPVLSPALSALGANGGERHWISPKIFWRSSAPGLDFLAFFTPNPLHPWFGHYFEGWLSRLPHTFIENVASIPWTVLAVLIAAAVSVRRALPRYWVAFTALFAWLSLGPFVHVAGQNLYVPTHWAILRYLPVIGAARMPTRLIAVVMFGTAVLLAFAIRGLRDRVRRPSLLVAAITTLLVIEMFPGPRTLHSAAVPDIYRIIARDPRPVAVLTLPFGLKDGLASHGNGTASPQFFQTVHGKPIVGGYVSRLPSASVSEYLSRRVSRALIDLCEGRSLTPERRATVIRRAHEVLPTLNIGYVVINRARRPSEELIEFARDAFDLTHVATEGERLLFRTRLASNP